MAKILSKWYFYLLSIAVSVSAFCILVSVKTNPKRTEKISILIGSYDAKVTDLENELKNNKPEQVKDVQIRYLNLHAKNFQYLFSSLRDDVDMFILPISYVEGREEGTVKYAANLDEEYVNHNIGKEPTYYSYDDKNKGIQIYDSESDVGCMKDYITYNEDDNKSDYYLFFSYKSKNIGKINNSKSETAYQIVKEMYKL